ncbi:hypothetical protein [Xenorhabdus littoralis]|uniref:hypothetical protein n=1 Tax=Xenorhabdus littoralis TaxID=2582835 RepID=UPI0029E820C9|nr:hypothetical protein [Xenorhabdus sp. psl]
MMKKYQLLISIVMALNISACSSDTEATEATASLKPDHGRTLMVANRHNDKSIHSNMVFNANNKVVSRRCGTGYVVGVWTSADTLQHGWAVWLSETGRSWSNKDVKIYWAYDKSGTDNNAGKSLYATILAAQANGQTVAVRDVTTDDNQCEMVHQWEDSKMDGPRFNSAIAWYP